MFIDGFFHGDPHPGNILILEDNVVCYLDLGMMGFFDEKFKRDLSEVMLLFVDQDVDGLINQLMYMDILDYDIDTNDFNIFTNFSNTGIGSVHDFNIFTNFGNRNSWKRNCSNSFSSSNISDRRNLSNSDYASIFPNIISLHANDLCN